MAALVPPDLRYTADHEWVQWNSDQTKARVGITDYAQQALGDVVYVSLPETGVPVEQGQSCAEVESTKSVSDVYAPVSGTISVVNDHVGTDPALINTDPYAQGWMFELTVTGDIPELLSAQDYQRIINEES